MPNPIIEITPEVSTALKRLVMYCSVQVEGMEELLKVAADSDMEQQFKEQVRDQSLELRRNLAIVTAAVLDSLLENREANKLHTDPCSKKATEELISKLKGT